MTEQLANQVVTPIDREIKPWNKVLFEYPIRIAGASIGFDILILFTDTKTKPREVSAASELFCYLGFTFAVLTPLLMLVLTGILAKRRRVGRSQAINLIIVAFFVSIPLTILSAGGSLLAGMMVSAD